MNYRLNLDRMVIYSVLLWVLLPPGLLSWSANPPGADNIRWLQEFCGGYITALSQVGIVGAVFGFVCALVTWLAHRQNWSRIFKIALLFIFPVLVLMLWGGWEFALFYLPVALICPLVYLLWTSRGEK